MNYEVMKEQLGTVCRTPALCGTCAGKECLVGYAKYCLEMVKDTIPPFVESGMEGIPTVDIRGSYDEYDVLHLIAKCLSECRECKEYHNDNCALNVIRTCMEVIALGDEQEFEGNPLAYMMKLGQDYPEKGAIVLEQYKMEKDKL